MRVYEVALCEVRSAVFMLPVALLWQAGLCVPGDEFFRRHITMLCMLELVIFVSQVRLSSCSWACPACMRSSICDAISAAPVSTLTNCVDTNDLVLHAADVPKEHQGEVIVDLADIMAVREAFTPAWVRVHTGAAHEYVVEQIGDAFRVYMSNAEGPLNAKEWLSGDTDFAWLSDYADALFGFKGSDRWSFMFNPLPHGHPLHGWWSKLIEGASKADFVEAIADKYRETWRRYGQGKLISLTDLQVFLATPLQAGGGSAPLDAMGGPVTVTVWQYAVEQHTMDCMLDATSDVATIPRPTEAATTVGTRTSDDGAVPTGEKVRTPCASTTPPYTDMSPRSPSPFTALWPATVAMLLATSTQ